MHIQSKGPDGQYYGWDSEKDIPANHIRLTDEEIQMRLRPEPLTDGQVEALRLAAYADPFTGSDRLFAEANRLQVTGAPQEEINAVVEKGAARYAEIQKEYPWPSRV